jgi:hypothetical protein
LRPFTDTYRPVTAHDWALYIDIEGYCDLFASAGCVPMAELTSAIHSLWASDVPACHNLQAVQYGGDGFLIHQFRDPRSKFFKQPIAIACALMKFALTRGFTLRAQLSTGDTPAILGCYSKELQEHIRTEKDSGYLMYRHGFSDYGNLMLLPLNGSAILNAFRLHYPKGPLLVVDPLLKHELAEQSIAATDRIDSLEIDWLGFEDPVVAECLRAMGIGNNCDYPSVLRGYVHTHSRQLSTEWKDNVGLLCNRK